PKALRELKETLEEAGGVTKKQMGKLDKLIEKLESKASDWISKNCKGSINQKFPSELRDKTLDEIRQMGTEASKTAWKLLNDSRFRK
ncbi:MAG: hypothetical protein JNM34_05500, partial [Chthonomonadaceae bacterium]|nr:hypothetical protein [Chthonomonadaceae bacterium]